MVGGNIVFVKSLDNALLLCELRHDIEKSFVIGGERLYMEALAHKNLRKVHVTIVYGVDAHQQYDSYFPIDILHKHYNHCLVGAKQDKKLQLIFQEHFRKMSGTQQSLLG